MAALTGTDSLSPPLPRCIMQKVYGRKSEKPFKGKPHTFYVKRHQTRFTVVPDALFTSTYTIKPVNIIFVNHKIITHAFIPIQPVWQHSTLKLCILFLVNITGSTATTTTTAGYYALPTYIPLKIPLSFDQPSKT